jgi:hypothetical protein
VLEHQAAFVDMLRVGRDMRKRMFDTLEERHADDFGNGKAGRRLYDDLLSAVRDAGVPEAVTEFESRFLPLLNKKRPQADAQPGFAADLDVMSGARGRWRAGWVWTWSLAGAVAIAGALYLGYNFLKTTTGQSPTVTEAPPGAAQPAGAPSETPAVTEAPVAPAGAAEPVSEPPVATGAPVPAEHEQTSEPDTPTGAPAQDMPAEPVQDKPAEPVPDKPPDQDPDR